MDNEAEGQGKTQMAEQSHNFNEEIGSVTL